MDLEKKGKTSIKKLVAKDATELSPFGENAWYIPKSVFGQVEEQTATAIPAREPVRRIASVENMPRAVQT